MSVKFGTLYCHDEHHLNVWRNQILIASKMCNKIVEIKPFTEEIKKRIPLSKCFAFETEKFASNSLETILTQISSEKHDNTKILDFLSLSNEIHMIMKTLVYPAFGLISPDKHENEEAQKNLFEILNFLNNIKTKFLTSDKFTIADISVFCEMLPLFENYLDSRSREKYGNFVSFMNSCFNQDCVKFIIKQMTPCEKPVVFNKKLYDEIHTKDQKSSESKDKVKGEKSPKKSKKKDEKKEEKQKKKEECNKGEDEEKVVPRKDPFSNLPVTKFDFEQWKRTFYNSDIHKVALPWFWNNFDKENTSLWWGIYKYNDELTMGFMIANFVNGVFSRVEKLRKIGFGLMYLANTGQNGGGNFELTCLWIFRGHQLAFELEEDLNQDAPLFEFKKLDFDCPNDRETITNYLSQKENFRKFPLKQTFIFT